MKTTLIIAFMALSLSASGQFFQELDFRPRGAIDYFANGLDILIDYPSPSAKKLDLGSFRVRAGASLSYRKAGIYVDQQVLMNGLSERGEFQPTMAKWDIGAFYEIMPKLKFSFEHSCLHPVLLIESSNSRVNGGYNMFSISYGY